jgi:hypothetical protein
MKALFLGLCLTGALTGAAHADRRSDIDKKERLGPSSSFSQLVKPGSLSNGVSGHEHIRAAVTSMCFRLHDAETLCAAGDDHEALLHVKVVRAFLDLPEFQHRQATTTCIRIRRSNSAGLKTGQPGAILGN